MSRQRPQPLHNFHFPYQARLDVVQTDVQMKIDSTDGTLTLLYEKARKLTLTLSMLLIILLQLDATIKMW